MELREATTDTLLETSWCEHCRKSDWRNIGRYDCATCGTDNRAPYSFCRHPEKCIPAGRCTAQFCCND